jgi:hypothetical protein
MSTGKKGSNNKSGDYVIDNKRFIASMGNIENAHQFVFQEKI